MITIQPATQADLKLPYPYHIEPDGSVARQDVWRGNPRSLCGFQARLAEMQVDLDLEDFLADPQHAVGMYPVFDTEDGGMFTATIPIASVTVADG